MNIDVLCNDGSPLGVALEDLWGKGNRGIGVGGSEYALLTVCEGLANRGHKVTLYNNPSSDTSYSPFRQKAIAEYNYTHARDVLIVFRSPNDRAVVTTNCRKVWWSCDQYTVGSFQNFAPYVDKIVCISPFHAKYFQENYGITNTTVIDIPVRLHDFCEVDEVKITNRCIFTSVPDRGLHILFGIWKKIKAQIPDASLVITSDYRLWGADQRNELHRVKWMGAAGVEFLGAVPREKLIIEQAKAQLLIYPCIYDELFCVSVAEAQCLGVYPITSERGALATTNMGTIVPGNPDDRFVYADLFASNVVAMLDDQLGWLKAAVDNTWKARDRFSLDKVLDKWENEIFG